MVSKLEDGEYWRQRAEESRARADMMYHADMRDLLLKIADQYERLGERADRYARLVAKKR